MALCLAATQNPTPEQDPAAGRNTFKNYNRTYQIELPEGWRQIAPGEAVTLSEVESELPAVHPTNPRKYYTVGPIDKWLKGQLDGPWLQAMERADSMYLDDDYAELVRDTWRKQTETTDISHVVEDVQLKKVGTQQIECVVVVRTSSPPAPRVKHKSLDIHAPTAKQQVLLSFGCPEDQFARWQPEFERWLETLTFARKPEEPATLTDRLWTPILVGGAVGLVLLLLYKHTRSGR